MKRSVVLGLGAVILLSIIFVTAGLVARHILEPKATRDVRAGQSPQGTSGTAGKPSIALEDAKKSKLVLRPDMTLADVADASKIPVKVLSEKLKIPPDVASTGKLKDLSLVYGFKMEDVQKIVLEKSECVESCTVE